MKEGKRNPQMWDVDVDVLTYVPLCRCGAACLGLIP